MIVGVAFALGLSLEVPAEVGQETVVVVVDPAERPAAGETVRVVHRPGLSDEEELAIGITDGRGRVRWTPQQGGVARVRAGDDELPLRIAGASSPLWAWWACGLALGVVAVGVGWRGRR